MKLPPEIKARYCKYCGSLYLPKRKIAKMFCSKDCRNSYKRYLMGDIRFRPYNEHLVTPKESVNFIACAYKFGLKFDSHMLRDLGLQPNDIVEVTLKVVHRERKNES